MKWNSILAISAAAIITLASATCVAIELKVATFKADVTPPPGSPLCDGMVPPATGTNDPLTARGIILKADDQKPVVLVAVDWVGIGNEGHDAWREALAKACDTPLDRVTVHTLHQHDAPGCDFLADRIAAEAGLAGGIFNVEFAREAIQRVATAAGDAMSKLEPVTHVGHGVGKVEKVASNRRILGPNGKVQFVRFSSSGNDAKLRELPEGLIDPNVRLVSFWNNDKPLAVMSYYATHPQSYYYTGKCSADFVGMGRDEAEAAEQSGMHIHFNGASGNVTAGKYNDGSHEMRPVLAHRLAAGMKAAWDATKKIPVNELPFDWATRDVSLPLGEWLKDDERLAILNDKTQPLIPRLQAARAVAFSRRMQGGHKISISRLRVGPIDIVHLPGEPFIEYQLAAQKMRPDAFVCTAGYGDYGPGYIGTAEAYAQGGYETGIVSRVSPRTQAVLMETLQELLK